MSLQSKGLAFWEAAMGMTYRKLMLWSIGLALVIAIIQGLLGGAWVPLLIAAVPIGILFVVISLAIAAIMAFPGWLIRGSYDVKPLTVALLMSTHSYYLAGHILEPLMILPSFKWITMLVQVPMTVLAGFLVWCALLMTSLPHRWAGRFTHAALVLALLAGLGTVSTSFRSDRSAYVKKTFEDLSPGFARTLGGSSLSTKEFSSELLRTHSNSP